MHGIDYLQYKYMLYYCAMIGYAEMAISRQRGVPDTPQTTPLTTPHDTPRETPSASPTHSPSRESLPPFPDDVSYENSSAPVSHTPCNSLQNTIVKSCAAV